MSRFQRIRAKTHLELDDLPPLDITENKYDKQRGNHVFAVLSGKYPSDLLNFFLFIGSASCYIFTSRFIL